MARTHPPAGMEDFDKLMVNDGIGGAGVEGDAGSAGGAEEDGKRPVVPDEPEQAAARTMVAKVRMGWSDPARDLAARFMMYPGCR